MARLRTANPILSDKTFERTEALKAEAMTIQGTVNRTAVLLGLLVAAAAYTWHLVGQGDPSAVMPWMFGGLIGGLVLGLITVFAQKAAPWTAPLYAICQGLFLGGISAIFDAQFRGIVIQAVGLTIGVLATLLVAYSLGFIRATPAFVKGIVAATGAICLVYLASLILGLFRIQMPFLHDTGPIGIGISLVIVVIAALNLVLDFAFIEQGAKQKAPKYLEWYGAFGLLVTLIWLYLEILRLLSKLRRR